MTKAREALFKSAPRWVNVMRAGVLPVMRGAAGQAARARRRGMRKGEDRVRTLAKALRRLIVAAVASAVLAQSVHAAENGERFPRFASFKAQQTYMREGPSKENRVKWVYHRRGMPVEVLAKYDVWRRIRDWDGEIGWVHVAMLSPDRTVLIVGPENAVMRESERYGTAVVAEIQPGAVGQLKACGRLACEVAFGNVEGWVDRSRLYGVYVDELF